MSSRWLFFLSIPFWQVPAFVAFSSCFHRALIAPKSTGAKETYASLLTAALSIFLQVLFTQALLLFGFFELYEKLIARHQLFSIPFNLYTFLIYLVVTDFCFYLSHRLSHHVPLLWAAHGVHHSGKVMTPALIVRKSFFDDVLYMVVYIPVLMLGFSGVGMFFCFQFVSLNQSFCHTERNWPRFLDRFWVTPRTHRIHHSLDKKHVNRNFGGFLGIWDLVFGTRVLEDSDDESTRTYGLSDGFDSRNPLRIMFHLPLRLLATLRETKNPTCLFVPIKQTDYPVTKIGS